MRIQVYLFFLAILLTGCEKELISDHKFDEQYAGYSGKDSVSSNVIFSISETYDNSYEVDTPKLRLNIRTTEIYSCMNFELACSEYNSDNTLIIRFNGITHSDICLTALGPAQFNTRILENINTLILINGQTIDGYILKITKEKVDFTPVESSFTKPEYTRYYRYPENSFAYLCGTNSDNQYIYEEFLDTLLTGVELREFVFGSNGVLPYPESSNGYWNDPPAKYFLYSLETDFDKAGEILKAYTDNNLSYGDGTTISLIGWNNKNFRSWLKKK